MVVADIDYPVLMLRMIVPRPGLLPYMSKKALTIFMVNSSPTAIVINSTKILRTICQAATSVAPRRTIRVTGAVIGKIVRKTKTGLLGNMIIREENQSGETAASVKIVASC